MKKPMHLDIDFSERDATMRSYLSVRRIYIEKSCLSNIQRWKDESTKIEQRRPVTKDPHFFRKIRNRQKVVT